MNDDLTRPLDSPTGDNPGQSEGANVQGKSGPTQQDFNALKSIKDREVAAATRRAEEAERKARQAELRAEQVSAQASAMLQTVRDSNPEAADLLIKEAALAEKDAELQQARARLAELDRLEEEQRLAQEHEADARKWWNETAQKMGMDPNDPDYQRAVSETIVSGDQTYAQRALMGLSGNKPQHTQVDPEDPGDYVSPPTGGGGRISDEDRLMKEYLEKRKLFQGDTDRLWALKKQYRDKGLTIP